MSLVREIGRVDKQNYYKQCGLRTYDRNKLYDSRVYTTYVIKRSALQRYLQPPYWKKKNTVNSKKVKEKKRFPKDTPRVRVYNAALERNRKNENKTQ